MMSTNYGSYKGPIKKKKTAATSNDTGTKKDDVQGMTINKTTNKATPNSHEVKVVKYGSGTSSKTKIIGTDGSVKYDGRTHDAATKEALRKTTNQVGDVLNRRKKNADYYNKTNMQKDDPKAERKNARNFIK